MATVNQKPKHKPSEKHTLEEVLKSLQDLIRNEIIGGTQSLPPASTGGVPPPQPTMGMQKQRAVDKGAADETDIDAVLDSLKDLIVHELESPETEAGEPATEQERLSDQLEEITFETPDATSQVEDQPLDIDMESLAPPSPPAPDADITTDAADGDIPEVQAEQSEPRQSRRERDWAHEVRPEGEDQGWSESQPPAPPGGAQETFAFDEPLPTIEVEETSFADISDIDFLVPEVSIAPETEEHTPDRADTPLEAPIELTPESEAEPLMAPDAPVNKEEVIEPADVPATGDRDIPADTDTEDVAEISFDALPADLSSIPRIEFENVLEKTEETPPPETDDRSQEKPPSTPLPEEPVASVDYPSPAGLEAEVIPGVTPEEAPAPQPVEEKPASSDDIPVLDEVAAQPPEEEKPVPSEISLPAPGRAREIAIKIIAKLNIELRKCGERGLSPATIDRLQYLLREALKGNTKSKS